MLKRFLSGVLAMILPGGAIAAPSACEAGAKLHYPLSEVLLTEARTLALSRFSHPEQERDPARAYLAVVDAALAPLDPLEADIRLLALLEAAGGPMGNVMPALTTSPASVLYDRFLETLDRHALKQQAKAMRAARDAFTLWDGTAKSRRLQLITKDGMVADPTLMAALDEQSARYTDARPRVIDHAAALVAKDPARAARYEAARQATDDDARLLWLMRQINDCTDQDWLTPREADRALAKLPPAQRDLLVLSIFMSEVHNGGGIQLYHNSSGTLIPQMADAMDRHGLLDHAAALGRGMSEFPSPYPRATRERRETMDTLTDAQMESLDGLMDMANDPQLTAVMVRIAKDAGIWPS
jgi:hypothetical protein